MLYHRSGGRSRYKFKPTKAEAREFAEKMAEIDEFCTAHGIKQSMSGDSYYFTLNGNNYRVSNHTIKASNRGAYNEMGEQVRELYHGDEAADLICFTAGKTRIIEIYTAIAAGKTLDKRGNVKYEH